MIEPVAHLRRVCARRADQPALLSGRTQLSYRQLFDRAAAIAAGLRRRGLRGGDRFAVRLANGVEFVACYLAAISGGTTIVPIHSAWSRDETEYVVRLTRPALMIESVEQIPSGSRGEFGEEAGAEAVAAIYFTSGTTSRPKGILHSVRAMVGNAVAFNELTGLSEEVRMLHVMPMGYMAGFLNTVLCPLAAGGTVVLGPAFEASNAAGFWRPAIDHEVNAAWISPTIAALLGRLNRSDEVPRWAAERLDHLFVGTAPLPEAVRSAFESTFGVDCLESYGMSELMLVASNSRQRTPRVGSVGRLVSGVEVETRDDDGRPLAPAGEGELFVRSIYALQGYLDPESGAAASPLDDGWFATGDLGQRLEDGELSITGRIKDLIIHGGANVSPRAVEEVLLRHPAVRESVVVGVPHPFWGEEVVAFLVPEKDATPDPKELTEYCRGRLGADSVPARFELRPELPRGSTGKVLRQRIKELL